MNLLQKVLLIFKPLVIKFPLFTNLYRAVRDEIQLYQPAKLTPWGFKMAGNKSMVNGEFEPVETKVIRDLLQEVDTVINVGANIGYYCCHALSLDKKVIAFEPLVRNLRFLYKNVYINNWTNIRLYPLALSNKSGIVNIYGSDTGASLIKGWAGISEDFKNFVPCSTLDLVLGSSPVKEKALVIVDVEGAEQLMLDGASELLQNDPKPIWFIEIMSKDHQPGGLGLNPNIKDIFLLFFNHGYSAYSVSEKVEKISMDDVIDVTKGLREFLSHNFIFR